jgi:hypothetical protein
MACLGECVPQRTPDRGARYGDRLNFLRNWNANPPMKLSDPKHPCRALQKTTDPQLANRIVANCNTFIASDSKHEVHLP